MKYGGRGCGGGGGVCCGFRILFRVSIWPSDRGDLCHISSITLNPFLVQGFAHVVPSAWGPSAILYRSAPSHSLHLNLAVITLEILSQVTSPISFKAFVMAPNYFIYFLYFMFGLFSSGRQ